MKNPTGLSDAMIDAIIDYGFSIIDTVIDKENKKVRIALQVYGYMNEEFILPITFNGTDADFVRALTEAYDAFDPDKYSEEMHAGADESEIARGTKFKLCGEAIQFSLNDLVNDCENVLCDE